MKVYTGTGDKGKTSLFSGQRVFKDDLRVEAYGAVDELNSAVGVLVSMLTGKLVGLRKDLTDVQANLFRAGAVLATAGRAPMDFPEHLVAELERVIDHLDDRLPDLHAFVLPGGNRAAAWAHMTRTVCRRAERRLLTVMRQERQEPAGCNLNSILVYINRLSDYLFVLARYCNHVQATPEPVWTPEK